MVKYLIKWIKCSNNPIDTCKKYSVMRKPLSITSYRFSGHNKMMQLASDGSMLDNLHPGGPVYNKVHVSKSTMGRDGVQKH